MQVFADGNSFEVETFTTELMTSRHPEAQTKFLFVFLPLRSPNKYGLSSTQALQIMTKVLIASSDCYAASKDARLKAIWLDAFADVATCLIEDDDLLSGMLMDVPSSSSVEALASTELMSVILTVKFNCGPVLLFWVEVTLFVAQLALMLAQLTSKEPELWNGVLCLLLTIYFTGREVKQM